MSRQDVINVLNELRGMELAVIIQYMKHHYEAEGMDSPAISDQFKKAAMDEMKHAEALGERINFLGGEPTKQPAEILSGGDLYKMIDDDIGKESEAIHKYRQYIELAFREQDHATRLMLERILAVEEEHLDMWITDLARKLEPALA